MKPAVDFKYLGVCLIIFYGYLGPVLVGEKSIRFQRQILLLVHSSWDLMELSVVFH